MQLNVTIDFGTFAPFISTQLEQQGLSKFCEKEKMLNFEKLRTAMTELYFQDIITESELNVMRKKLLNKILSYLTDMVKKALEEQSNA